MSINVWGPLTWKLFHTLAEKVDETKFFENKDKLVKVIIDICKHLPCPECSKDAVNILDKAYIKNIKTKKHFIEFIRQFHNIVNIKLHKKMYSITESDDMYKDVNLTILLKDFFNIFFIKQYNTKLMTHNTQRHLFKRPLYKQLSEIITIMI